MVSPHRVASLVVAAAAVAMPFSPMARTEAEASAGGVNGTADVVVSYAMYTLSAYTYGKFFDAVDDWGDCDGYSEIQESSGVNSWCREIQGIAWATLASGAVLGAVAVWGENPPAAAAAMLLCAVLHLVAYALAWDQATTHSVSPVGGKASYNVLNPAPTTAGMVVGTVAVDAPLFAALFMGCWDVKTQFGDDLGAPLL